MKLLAYSNIDDNGHITSNMNVESKEESDAIEGELLIGGIGVVRGYIHAPDITAQRFIDDPYVTVTGIGIHDKNNSISTTNDSLNWVNKVYRTGDLVKIMKGGNFVFVRRMDIGKWKELFGYITVYISTYYILCVCATVFILIFIFILMYICIYIELN